MTPIYFISFLNTTLCINPYKLGITSNGSTNFEIWNLQNGIKSMKITKENKKLNPTCYWDGPLMRAAHGRNRPTPANHPRGLLPRTARSANVAHLARTPLASVSCPRAQQLGPQTRERGRQGRRGDGESSLPVAILARLSAPARSPRQCEPRGAA
jgi:hypothetical protein